MDLTNLFTPVSLLRDENNDDIPDAVRGRLILLRDAPAAAYVAAASVAARLGLETMSLSLPIAQCEGEVPTGHIPIHIHTRTDAAGSELPDVALPASHGLVQVHGDGASPAIRIVGADEAGLQAATRWLAFRAPWLWQVDASAPILADVRHGAARFLADAGLRAETISVVAARLSAEQPGLDTLQLDVQLVEQRLPVTFEDLPAYLAGRDVTNLALAGLRQLRLHLRQASNAVIVELPGDERLPEGSPAEATSASGSATPYDLENLYTTAGLLADTNGDLQSDATRCTLILAEACTAEEGLALVNLAARLGLESAGITWPLAKIDTEIESLAEVMNPVLLGAANRFHQSLGRPLPSLNPGQGAIALVPHVEAGGDVLVVAGGDSAGAAAAADWLAGRWPALTAHTGLILWEVKESVADFLALRDSGAQAAAVVAALRDLAQENPDIPITVTLPATLEPLHAFFDESSVAVEALQPVLEQSWQIPWEVDVFWKLWRERVRPHLKAGDRLELDLRLSEPRAVREELRRQIAHELAQVGLRPEDATLRVRSAYKQGLCWLGEEVSPALTALQDVAGVTLFFAPFHSPQGPDVLPPGAIRELHMVNQARAQELEAQQRELAGDAPPWHELPLRWLQDVYPADELIARELGIEPDQIEFVSEEMDVTYRVEARGSDGRTLFTDHFTCTFAERAYLEPLPHLGVVHPPAGWLRATVNGQTLVDERIPTDLERFWDRYQAEFLPALGEWVKSRAGAAGPLFSRLEFNVQLSEADERSGLREELFSPLEALHEDLYFVTLKYVKSLGLNVTPGQVVPCIGPREGQAGEARITVFPPERATFTLETEPPQTIDLQPLQVSALRVTGVRVEAGQPTVRQVQIEVELDADPDQAIARFEALPTLWEAGLYHATLAWPEVDELLIRIRSTEEGTEVRLAQPATLSPPPDEPDVQDTVPWDRVIGLAEEAAIVRGLGRRPEVAWWRAGRSFERRDILALDVTWPVAGALRPRAKAGLFKPTCLINARHHGNEPSATNAALRLADRLSSDPETRELLRRVNVAIIPTENVDGAALSYELQQAYPHWMLHAGRYNALGEEFHREYFDADTLHREALALPRVWQTWLPDVLVDDHGFPSHEWMQPFSGGYSSDYPAYWLPRALFYGYLPYVDDEAYPNRRLWAERVRQAASRVLTEDVEIRAWNTAWARAYEKYLHRWLPDVFPLTLHEGVIFYFYPVQARPDASFRERGTSFASKFPQVTALSWVTEVADETAQGPYMALSARAHLVVDLATLRLLAEATVRIERRLHETPAGLTLSLHRELIPSHAYE